MKKILSLFIFLFLLLGFNYQSKASHIAALDLTLSCIGGNDYIVKFVLYRDCSGIPAETVVNLTFICSSNSAYNFTLSNVPRIPGTGQEVTQNCVAMPTRCSSGVLYGIQEYVFQAQVTLPPCNYWTVSWTICCRNFSNTISSSTSQSAYIQTQLNNLQFPCNSNPYFTNKPLTVLCQGQTTCFNIGAIDPDGDSLSYFMVDPNTNSSSTYVNWIPPYTATQPIPSNPPITCDTITGDICITPTMNIISPMAIKIEQWRMLNGVPTLVGITYRDIQINVVTCSNQIPKLSGMDPTLNHGYSPNDTTYAIEICLGDTVNFAMWGKDDDVYNPSNTGNPEKFTLTWNNGIPQGTFTSYYNNSDSAKATFYWVPTPNMVSNTPKCFTVTIRDAACPFNGSQTYSYCITVRGMSVNIGKDTLVCKGETITFTAVADTTTVNYIWKLDGVPTGVPLSSTTYTLNTTNLAPGQHIISIETNDGATTVKCPGVDNLNLLVVLLPHPDLGNDTVICEPNSITLDAGIGQMYLWSPTGQTTKTIQANTTGFYTVIVDGGNGTRCIGMDTIYVEVVKLPLFNLGNDTCVSQPITIDVGLPGAFYQWSNGSTTQDITPTISGNYKVTVTYKLGSGCETYDDKIVNIINFDLGDDKVLCTHEHLILEAPIAPIGHYYNYYWMPDGQITNYITIKDKPIGTYIYSVDVGGGCYDEILVTIEYCPVTIPNVFTPNGDGKNDKFYIEGIDNYPGSKLLIFNRWGTKVFESENYSNSDAWTGNDLAQAIDGVYYWILHLNDGKNTIKHGSVTILGKK